MLHQHVRSSENPELLRGPSPQLRYMNHVSLDSATVSLRFSEVATRFRRDGTVRLSGVIHSLSSGTDEKDSHNGHSLPYLWLRGALFASPSFSRPSPHRHISIKHARYTVVFSGTSFASVQFLVVEGAGAEVSRCSSISSCKGTLRQQF